MVGFVGNRTRDPIRKKAWQQFVETGDVLKHAAEAYPGEEWKPIRETTIKIAKLMGERLRPEEASNSDHVEALVQLSLMLGLHIQLDEALQEAASELETSVGVMSTILRTARVAELSSYGRIAEKRVQVIQRIIGLKDDDDTLEQALQESLEQAPWLINPLWSPITANQSLSTLRSEFEKFYKRETGKDISLEPFDAKTRRRRPDFVLSADDFGLQIYEIKKPHHSIQNDEWDRVEVYIEQMTKFLDHPGHHEYRAIFKRFTVTLVCDDIGLRGSQLRAFNSYKQDRAVEHITWSGFLRRTEHMHQEFLKEARRQQSLVAMRRNWDRRVAKVSGVGLRLNA